MIEAMNLSGMKYGSKNLPILDFAHLKAEGESLTVTSGTGEIFTQRTFAGEAGHFETCVPFQALAEWTSATGGPFKFDLEEKLVIRCKRNRTSLKTDNPENYPWLPQGEPSFKANLVDAVSKVAWAVGKNRPVLSVVYLDNGKAVATDGFRLAVADYEFEGEEHHLLVPPEALKLLPDEMVRVALANQKIIFSGSTERVIAVPLNETYPKYQRLLPQKFVAEVRIDAKKLLRSIKTALLFYENIRLVITQKNDINIWSVGAETGDCQITQEAQVEGVALEIYINGRYLVDGLSAIEGEVVLKSEGINGKLQMESSGWKYVVMPLVEK